MSPKEPPLLQCSFCGKSQDQVHKLIAGPSIYICDECIHLCNDILKDEGLGHEHHDYEVDAEGAGSKEAKKLPKPAEIKTHLDEYVIGNDDTKKTLAVAVYNHYKRIAHNAIEGESDVEIQKSNILLLGPTGSGKTHVVETLAKYLNVPFAIADATSITEAGYVGEDAENILQRLYQTADMDLEQAERGIIYIDEIDKITRKSESASITRDVSGEGVQQSLLKLIEGTMANIPPQGGRKHPHMEMLQLNTKNILFICGGAFVGLDSVIEKRRLSSQANVGFGSKSLSQDERQKMLSESLKHVEPEDLVHFGMIPEFVGRMPVLTSLDAPDESTLRTILTEPKSSIIKQYQKLLELDGVELIFEDDALKMIAKKALKRKMGARALRSIVEAIMKDIMFEIPSREDVKKVTITEEMVKNLNLAKVLPLKGSDDQSSGDDDGQVDVNPAKKTA